MCERLPPDIPSQQVPGSFLQQVKRKQTKAEDAVQVAISRSYFSKDSK
jgi:hypothetical protein